MIKVYISYTSILYEALFTREGFHIVKNLKEADLVVFTGGVDVDPAIYGQAKHSTTFISKPRDVVDLQIYKEAVTLDIPMVGICRGAQFLNVMNGGLLYQDVDGHGTYTGHMLTDTKTGKEVLVTSTHHQMMIPADHGEVLATARESTRRDFITPSGTSSRLDPEGPDIEVVFYPVSKCLCFQPHPEMPKAQGPCRDYFWELLESTLGVSKSEV